jgi:AraC-like DNA-binding protein
MPRHPSDAALARRVPHSLLHDDVLRRLARARESLWDDYSEACGVASLARGAGFSEKHFRRLFEQVYGVTPGRFLAGVRILRAKERLARGASVTEACMAVGFSSLGTFSTKFTRQMGCTPRQYQQRLRTLSSVPARLISLYVPFCFFPLPAPL